MDVKCLAFKAYQSYGANFYHILECKNSVLFTENHESESWIL